MCWSCSSVSLWKVILRYSVSALPSFWTRGKPLGAQVGQDVLDAPQAVGPRLDAQADPLGGVDELLLDVLGHQPAFFDFQVPLLEAGEIHVGAGQGDAGGLLVFA